MALPPRGAGFTLVELLVVVTIIVLLMALLAPAMDRAIHEAEMTVCAGNQGGVNLAQLTYAMDHARWYPYRAAMHDLSSSGIQHRQLTVPANRGQMTSVQGYDDRPVLRPYMPVNSLQCPKTDKLDFEVGDAFDTYIYAGFTRFAGFRYHHATTTQGQNTTNPLAPGEPGPQMTKMGKGWTFKIGFGPNAGDWESHIMGGDHYLALGVFGWTVEANHQDVEGRLPLQTFQSADAPNQGLGDADAKKTISQWTLFTNPGADTLERNARSIDVNYHYDDGSVERFNALGWNPPGGDVDERSRRVPGWNELHIAGALIVPNNR